MEANPQPVQSFMPVDQDELLERIRQEWDALLAVITCLSEEQLLLAEAGAWSVKDHLHHLAAWENYLIEHHLRGRSSYEVLAIDPSAPFDEDWMNAILVQRCRECTLADVLQTLHSTHARVIAALEVVNFADLGQPGPADDVIIRPLLESIVCNTYEHYQEHRLTIQGRFPCRMP